jgi:hypothetical protein
MGKTQNSQIVNLSRLRGRPAAPRSALSATEISEQIIEYCQQSSSAQQAGEKLLAAGPKLRLEQIVPEQYLPLLTSTLGDAHFLGANGLFDVSGNNRHAEQLVAEGIQLRRPLQPEYLAEFIGDLRWTLALYLKNHIDHSGGHRQLVLAYQNIADHFYHCRMAPLPGQSAASEAQRHQAEHGRKGRELLGDQAERRLLDSLALSAGEQEAVQQAFATWRLLFDDPGAADGYQQIFQTLLLNQQIGAQSGEEAKSELARSLLQGMIFSNLSMLITRQRSAEQRARPEPAAS